MFNGPPEIIGMTQHSNVNNKDFIWHRQTMDTMEQSGDYVLHGFTATLVGGKVYVYGGQFGPFRQSILYVLDIHSRRWMTHDSNYGDYGTSHPGPRIMHAAALIGDEIYVISGRERRDGWNQLYHHDVYKFDLIRGKWEYANVEGEKFLPTYGHTAEYINERCEILVLGGYPTERTANLSNYTVFSLNLDNHNIRKPTIKGKGAFPRYRHASFRVGNEIFVFGGKYAGRHLNDFRILSLNKSSFTWSEPLLTSPSHRGESTLTLFAGMLFLCGGGRTTNHYQEINMYDPVRRKLIVPFESHKKGIGDFENEYKINGYGPDTVGHVAVANSKRLIVLGGTRQKLSNYYELVRRDSINETL